MKKTREEIEKEYSFIKKLDKNDIKELIMTLMMLMLDFGLSKRVDDTKIELFLTDLKGLL